MKKTNLSWVGALLVFALLLWCTAATPGKIDDPSTYTCAVYSSALSLLPPVVAIVLALNTKEVYTSLLVGIATGALLYANGNLELALTTLFFNEDGGMVSKLSDSSNVGILVFLVMLGILVALMNKAGGSAAFGRWASTHIHTRAGAQFATLLLGILIFVDDYFNCLTVGSVMRPVTDRQKVSRARAGPHRRHRRPHLYLIDATAAPPYLPSSRRCPLPHLQRLPPHEEARGQHDLLGAPYGTMLDGITPAAIHHVPAHASSAWCTPAAFSRAMVTAQIAHPVTLAWTPFPA